MTAPMTRERLAELVAMYEASRRGLSSLEQREALDALGVLLRDCAWLKRQRDDALKRAHDARVEMGKARAELARLKKEMAGMRDAALEEAARHFEAAAEAIEANARDPERPNIGCTTKECLDAAQDKRNVAATIRALKGKR